MSIKMKTKLKLRITTLPGFLVHKFQTSASEEQQSCWILASWSQPFWEVARETPNNRTTKIQIWLHSKRPRNPNNQTPRITCHKKVGCLGWTRVPQLNSSTCLKQTNRKVELSWEILSLDLKLPIQNKFGPILWTRTKIKQLLGLKIDSR